MEENAFLFHFKIKLIVFVPLLAELFVIAFSFLSLLFFYISCFFSFSDALLFFLLVFLCPNLFPLTKCFILLNKFILIFLFHFIPLPRKICIKTNVPVCLFFLLRWTACGCHSSTPHLECERFFCFSTKEQTSEYRTVTTQMLC